MNEERIIRGIIEDLPIEDIYNLSSSFKSEEEAERLLEQIILLKKAPDDLLAALLDEVKNEESLPGRKKSF